MGHPHIIIDDDNHFIIDPNTRKITPKTTAKNVLMQYDHNSERITFEIPKTVNGHDMRECIIEINYENTASNKQHSNNDIYTVPDIDKVLNGDTLYFSWLITESVTQLEGSLNFSICFKCVEDGIITYAWHSGIYSGISVSKGIHNSDVVIVVHSDAIEALKATMNANTIQVVEDYVAEHFKGDTGAELTTAQVNALYGLAICLRDAGCIDEYNAFCVAFLGGVPDSPEIPDTPTDTVPTTATLSSTGIVLNGNVSTVTLSSTGILLD